MRKKHTGDIFNFISRMLLERKHIENLKEGNVCNYEIVFFTKRIESAIFHFCLKKNLHNEILVLEKRKKTNEANKRHIGRNKKLRYTQSFGKKRQISRVSNI